MEKAAFDQLHEQAMQQEKIHKKMKDDMTSINGKTQEYQWIIKVISFINYQHFVPFSLDTNMKIL